MFKVSVFNRRAQYFFMKNLTVNFEPKFSMTVKKRINKKKEKKNMTFCVEKTWLTLTTCHIHCCYGELNTQLLDTDIRVPLNRSLKTFWGKMG